MPKIYELKGIKITTDELLDVCLKGFSDVREVKKDSPTSGAIRVPARYVGQSFRVILIPIDELDMSM